jgi:hypothetical protein
LFLNQVKSKHLMLLTLKVIASKTLSNLDYVK